MTFLKLYRETVASKIRERQGKLSDLADAVSLYYEVAKGWLMTAIKKPLISIVSDNELNFDFRDPSVGDAVKEQRLMRLKVRVKGILQDVIANTDATRMTIWMWVGW